MRRHELAANLIFAFPFLSLLGIVVVMCWPLNYIVLCALYACGFIDLVYAKLPLLRRRVYNTFGACHLPRKRRVAYFRGYRRIGLGIALNLFVIVYHFAIR